MKTLLAILFAFTIGLCSCSQNDQSNEEQEAIMELDSISEALDESKAELEEIQEEIQELDSLLNEI